MDGWAENSVLRTRCWVGSDTQGLLGWAPWLGGGLHPPQGHLMSGILKKNVPPGFAKRCRELLAVGFSKVPRGLGFQIPIHSERVFVAAAACLSSQGPGLSSRPGLSTSSGGKKESPSKHLEKSQVKVSVKVPFTKC